MSITPFTAATTVDSKSVDAVCSFEPVGEHKKVDSTFILTTFLTINHHSQAP